MPRSKMENMYFASSIKNVSLGPFPLKVRPYNSEKKQFQLREQATDNMKRSVIFKKTRPQNSIENKKPQKISKSVIELVL